MDYYFTDFTEDNYIKLLKIAKNNFNLRSYRDYLQPGRNLLWRHDIDISVNRALSLAKIEHSLDIKSTYFIYPHSNFYNLFELEITKKAREIAALGHDIGLHADIGFYSRLGAGQNIEESLELERMAVENLLQCELTAVSFHQPEYRNSLSIIKDIYAGMVNVYSDSIFNRYEYCSDSNGFWRFRRLEDVLLDPEIKSLQVLTHPEWWTPGVLPPAGRVRRCVDGRAAANWKLYCDELKDGGRPNIGEEDIR